MKYAQLSREQLVEKLEQSDRTIIKLEKLFTADGTVGSIKRRDAVLDALRYASSTFLQSVEWEKSFNELLARLGEAAEVSRVYIFENNRVESGEVVCSHRYEWSAPGITAQIGRAALQKVPLRASGYGRWVDAFGAGEMIAGTVSGFPPLERELLEPQGIRSLAVVPIFVSSRWWGFIGFDDCIHERKWTQTETDALKASGGIIGAALQRRLIEDQLKVNEQRMKLALEGSDSGVWDWNIVTGDVFFDEQALAMLGYLPGDIPPHVSSWEKLLHPDEREAVMEVLGKHLRGETLGYAIECRMKTKAGEWLWIVDAGKVVSRDDDGNPLRAVGTYKNIHTRRQAEELLRTNTLELQQLFDSLEDFLFVLDDQGRIIRVNNVVVDKLGYTREELIGISVLNIHPPERREEAGAIVKAMLEGSSEFCPVPLLCRDGRKIPVETKVWPGRWSDRDVLYGISRDITEKIASELALKESEIRYRGLVESQRDFIARSNSKGELIYVNDAYCARAEHTREELIGQLFLVQIHPDDREKVGEAMKRLDTPPYRVSVESRSMVAGLWRWTSWESYAIKDEQGRTTEIQTVGRDVTAQKLAGDAVYAESEDRNRRLSIVVEQSPSLITITDTEGAPEYVNPKFERVTGHTLASLRENGVSSLRSEEMSDEEYADLWETISSGKEWKGEARRLKKNGESYWERALVSPLRNGAGETTNYIVISEDITELKLLEMSFRRAQRLEILGTLSTGIAHDLNNVLSPIMLAIGMLRDRNNDETSRRVLGLVEMSAKRGADIVKQVLSFARGSEGERTIVQPRHVVVEILKIIRATFNRSVDIRDDIERDLWAVSGDPTQMHQVLMNLCVNARDAMPAGGLLEVSARNVTFDAAAAREHIDAHPGRYVRIDISDTGTGIPEEILERVFDPFFTTKEASHGTGLGLSTALSILQGHGGFIAVKSALGSGTSFSVYFPAVDYPGSGETGEQYAIPPAGHGETILAVDDEEPIREITRLTLEAYGYDVLLANDGIEALELFKQHRDEIALVITDIMMPNMDGFAVVKALRKLAPGLPVIAATGDMEHPGIEALAKVVHAVLQKPFKAEPLLKTVSAALGAKP